MTSEGVAYIGMAIGKKSGVIVSNDPQTGREKFASFHDLRRSCALRWAAHLKPQDLMEFMRHTSLQVTLDYYVGHRAMDTASAMWQVAAGKATGCQAEPKRKLSSRNPSTHYRD